MAQQGMLRVALEDTSDALQLVRTEVYRATGLTPEADLQEIEPRGELVIQVHLGDADGHTPAEVAKMVTARARHLDVLSAWTEPVEPVRKRPVRCQVIDLLQSDIPDLALRAHRDGVPTARWHHPTPTQTPHWLLAVPGMDADRRAVVGICRRAGYYYRFSSSDARGVVTAPASA